MFLLQSKVWLDWGIYCRAAEKRLYVTDDVDVGALVPVVCAVDARGVAEGDRSQRVDPIGMGTLVEQ